VKWMRPTILAAGVAVISVPQQRQGTAAMVEDRTYGDQRRARSVYGGGGRGLTFPDRRTRDNLVVNT